jgi:hypothetical protein
MSATTKKGDDDDNPQIRASCRLRPCCWCSPVRRRPNVEAAVLRDGGAGRRPAEASVIRQRGARSHPAIIAAAIAFDTETTSMNGESTKSAKNAANGGAGSETTTTGIGAIATSGRSKGRASRSVELMP